MIKIAEMVITRNSNLMFFKIFFNILKFLKIVDVYWDDPTSSLFSLFSDVHVLLEAAVAGSLCQM
jgi:hypothetical protein